jgi:hypothetical protein
MRTQAVIDEISAQEVSEPLAWATFYIPIDRRNAL